MSERGYTRKEISMARWMRRQEIADAFDQLAADGMIESKPEGASWWNSPIVITEKGRAYNRSGQNEFFKGE